jgi:pimeloyl-ACP methyl ester carboxylesterase
VVQIDRVLEEAGVADAVICGVSYGGLIASRYAGLRPHRVRELVLVSALAPGYVIDARVRFYARAPRLLSPIFGIGAWRRTRAELRAALPQWRERVRFEAEQVSRVLRARMSPPLMLERLRLLEGVDLERVARRITAPTLVVTGEETLDLSVPVSHTRTWGNLVPHASFVTVDRTGHLGLVTRPEQFTRAIVDFVDAAEREPRTRCENAS